MNVIKTDIEGVPIIEPRLFRDARGYFFESFSAREFKEKVELPLERETEGFEKYLILKILCQRSFILFKNGKEIFAIVILQHWLSILTQLFYSN